jgi:DNA-binding transcriptional regulator of glucitol operon
MNGKKLFIVLITIIRCLLCLTGGFVWGYFEPACDRQGDYRSTLDDLREQNYRVRAALGNQGAALEAANNEITRLEAINKQDASANTMEIAIADSQAKNNQKAVMLLEKIKRLQQGDAGAFEQLREVSRAIKEYYEGREAEEDH